MGEQVAFLIMFTLMLSMMPSKKKEGSFLLGGFFMALVITSVLSVLFYLIVL